MVNDVSLSGYLNFTRANATRLCRFNHERNTAARCSSSLAINIYLYVICIYLNEKNSSQLKKNNDIDYYYTDCLRYKHIHHIYSSHTHIHIQIENFLNIHYNDDNNSPSIYISSHSICICTMPIVTYGQYKIDFNWRLIINYENRKNYFHIKMAYGSHIYMVK